MFFSRSLCIFLVAVFAISQCYSQKGQIDKTLLKAYQSSDSSDYYFNSAKKMVRQKADSANYLYFKAFKKIALSQNDSAAYYFDRAIPLLKNLDSLNRLRKCYNQYHHIKLAAGNYESALEYSQKALSVAEQLKDTAYISLHLSDIGNVYHDFEDYKKGVFYAKKAFDIMNSSSKKDYKYLIFANNVIGINFDDWKKPDSALFYHYKNLKYLQEVEDTLRYSFVYNNIGNTLLKQKKYSEAKKYQARALAMDKIKNESYFLASDYTNMGTIAYNENNNQLAKEYFAEAEVYAKKSGSIEKMRDLALQRAWFYKKIGDYKKAYEFQEKFFVLRDSVFNEQRAGKVAEMETRYETEKKEKALAESRADLAESQLRVEQRNIFIYGLIALAIILGLLIYLIFFRHKLKTRQLQKEGELKLALSKIETQNQLEEQRLRISRDLHDNIGSQLTFIISSLDTLKYRLGETARETTAQLSSISKFTAQTIYELRDTIWAMNKSDISVEDLQVRISNFIENAKNSSSVHIRFYDFLKDKHFSSVQGMNIYRIMQEAVNNALKYSEATEITITLSETSNSLDEYPSSIMMEVKDNGKGFDLQKPEFGNGIANIKKRASDLGGKVEIISNLNEGTVVRLKLKNSE
ncbi:tetratricopeptide repeat protein [Aequorivita sp. H23M31]|uniref:histidine kinase n=1 Tax=Aequorivita ciconiae TaxID=2494375 RepID=A0A410G6G4_9FLAO|nr:tetratricopeptide repeat protein [Aequorivita sp. H23M31]QAA82830.1 tetratricopeptide repeat protein [Aequorivita sp. H23M31]